MSPVVASTSSSGIAGNPKASTRRCLFGLVDHEQMKVDLAELHKQYDEQANRRWDFDFRNETPLNSRTARYEWTPVARCRTVPDIERVWSSPTEEYTMAATGIGRDDAVREEVETGQLAPQTPEQLTSTTEQLTPTTSEQVTPLKRKREESLYQSKITDFFPRKKNTHCSTPTKRRRTDS